MATFKDEEGREWIVKVHYKALQDVRDRVGIDLLDEVSNEFKGFADPINTCNALYVICEKQCKGREMTDEDFGECLVGDTYPKAVEALMRSIVDFFPSGRRKVLHAAIDAVADHVKKTEEMFQQIPEGTLEKILNR